MQLRRWGNKDKPDGASMGTLFLTKEEYTIGQRQPLQEVMLGKLDSYV